MDSIYEQPKTTCNNPKDIIDWLNCRKNIIVIANDYGNCRLFHREKKGLSAIYLIIVFMSYK